MCSAASDFNDLQIQNVAVTFDDLFAGRPRRSAVEIDAGNSRLSAIEYDVLCFLYIQVSRTKVLEYVREYPGSIPVSDDQAVSCRGSPG